MKKRNCAGGKVRLSSDAWYYEESTFITVIREYRDTAGHVVYLRIEIPLDRLEKTINRYHTKKPGKWKEEVAK